MYYYFYYYYYYSCTSKTLTANTLTTDLGEHNRTLSAPGYDCLEVKKVNFEIYIADRKATTCT